MSAEPSLEPPDEQAECECGAPVPRHGHRCAKCSCLEHRDEEQEEEQDL